MKEHEILGARLVIQAFSRRARIRPSDVLRRRSGHRILTKVRAAIADELYGTGFSYPEVGKLMDRDHSTIQWLVKGNN